MQYHTSLSLFATVSLIIMKPKMPPHTDFFLSRIEAFLKTWAPSSPQGRCLTGQLAGLHVCRKAQRTVRTSLQHGAGERAQCRAAGPVPTQQHLATCGHTRPSPASQLPNLIETSPISSQALEEKHNMNIASARQYRYLPLLAKYGTALGPLVRSNQVWASIEKRAVFGGFA